MAEELARLVKDALRRLEEVEEALGRFGESLASGALAEALRGLEEAYARLAEAYPEAGPYSERAALLRRYVEALMVRARLYGLRGFFREAEYIEGHVRELRAFLVRLDELLVSLRRLSRPGRVSSGRSRVYPGV